VEGKTESASRACPAEPLTGVPVRAHGLAPARHAAKGGFISDPEAVLKHMIMQQLTASCASLPTPWPIKVREPIAHVRTPPIVRLSSRLKGPDTSINPGKRRWRPQPTVM
jgi:hypothetical protein